MSSIKRVCVYCGSSSRVDEDFKTAAREYGRLLAQDGIGLVYGGGRVGLMGIIADSVLEHGGEVVGIIPEHIQSREVEHTDLTELHIVDSMHTRKQMMVDRSDAFVVLPGGIGTLDETFEILTWRQLGIHDKPIVVANLKNYWGHMISLIDGIVEQGFMRENDKNTFQVADNIESINKLLKAAPEESFDPASKWI